MPASSLPPRPNLEWLRKAAKKKLAQLRRTQPDAKLADAQLAVAREHGFPSWRKLKAHVDEVARAAERHEDDVVVRFLGWVAAGMIDSVRAALDADPSLIHAVGPHPYWGGRVQAIHLAAGAGRRDMFDLVLERGADVNGWNAEYDHWSPLMIAADNPAFRDELLRRGARVGLVEALLLADDARVDELLRAEGLPPVVPGGGSLIAFARTTFAIDRLLEAGAPLELEDRWGVMPIQALSRLGERGAPLVQHMIARGAAASPAEFARLGDLVALERLAAADPSIVKRDDVMMAAIDARRREVVEWLLARGASANARTGAPSRHTALHAAARGGDLELVKLLLDAGADPLARDDEHDSTPAGWARTALEVRNDPACAQVAEYLDAFVRSTRTDTSGGSADTRGPSSRR